MSSIHSRPLLLTTYEEALADNLRVIQQQASGARVWAVAKARAYGHGLGAAVRGFSRADGLAVLELQEAATCRDLGWSGPILLLEGCFHPSDVQVAADLKLDLVVHHADQLDWLETRLGRIERAQLRLWIKLNTGMNRLGFPAASWPDLGPRIEKLRQRLGSARLGWLTHLARAEEPSAAELPLRRLDTALATLGAPPAEAVSVCNSAAVFTLPKAHRDWVRPGLALYGASPLANPLAPGQSAQSLGLRAASRLSSRVISVQHLVAGDTVGYGERYRAERPMRIGVIAGGYADGIMRGAPDGMPIWVADRCCPMVGRVSMDMVTVDLTEHPSAGIGSEVVFWGDSLPIDGVAQACATLAYELMTGVTERVHRRSIAALPADDHAHVHGGEDGEG